MIKQLELCIANESYTKNHMAPSSVSILFILPPLVMTLFMSPAHAPPGCRYVWLIKDTQLLARHECTTRRSEKQNTNERYHSACDRGGNGTRDIQYTETQTETEKTRQRIVKFVSKRMNISDRVAPKKLCMASPGFYPLK